MIEKVNISGVYNISNQHNESFPVFCDFGPEPGAAWTLIQSHSLNNNDDFKSKAFYRHDMPRNQDVPEWNNYRLSMSRMKSIQDVSTHWRATCNFPKDGVDYRDYIRVSLKSLNLLEKPSGSEFCLLPEFVNVRGHVCFNCTVLIGYSSLFSLHMDSYHSLSQCGCDFVGGIPDEDNFGYYCSVVTSVNHTNTRFRGITHCPCSGCENGVNKSELSFDIWWLYLNGTTPHLATRIHEVNPVREFKSQSADVKATQIPKRGQDNPDIPSTTWRSRSRLSRLSKFI